MPSLFMRILLFLSSYAPLAVMFVLLFWSKSPIIALASGAVALLSVAGTLVYLRVLNRLEGVPTTIADSHGRGEQVMSYIVTYIIPFLAVALTDWQQAVALVVFFVILGYLYVNSDMIHINPTLNLFGYRLYEVTLDNGATYSLITRGRVQKGKSLKLIRLGDEILFEKRR